MWLVLCQDGDPDADWVGAQLNARGLSTVVVTAGTLVHGAGWEHHIGASGTYTRVSLADGTVIESTGVHAILNRLYWLGADGFRGASAKDREYATGEFVALGQSWLHGLAGRIVNPPGPNGLAGSWRSASQWRWLASRAGLTLAPPETPEAGDQGALVVDDQIIGGDALPAGTGERLRRLRRLSGLDLVDCRFSPEADGGYGFSGVPFLAELRSYGAPAIDAIHRAMLARAEQTR